MQRLLAAVVALCLAANLASAQDATLVADSLAITSDNTLVAEGNVEVFFDGTRLTARRVIYDRTADRLTIEGPLTLAEGTEAVILADSAELDADLTDGILRSARLVLDQQLQIAAAQIARSGGRFTEISRAVVSSCEICEPGSAPIWEIRASRAIRDEEERQLYFEDAQLRVAGVPVFYIPRLRLPDPTLTRATGFLPASIEQRSRLNTGVKIPYFIKIGDHADLTFRAYLSPATRTLEAEFRQELRQGRLSFEGAISQDDIREGDTRAYLFAEGEFDLPRGFTLKADLELVSDTSYLLEYGYSDKDRLDSALEIGRVRDGQRILTAITAFRTLRASELPIEEELPNRRVELEYEERMFADPVWGQAWAEFGVLTLNRESTDPITGRDVSRVSAAMRWQANADLGFGLRGSADARVDMDYYAISEDPDFDDTSRIAPAAAVGLSWPLHRRGENGVRHLLEPRVQLAWSDVSGEAVPNEDSTSVEFDEGNLFALSRFPGSDAVETGTRANLGLTWTRFDPAGWSLGATVGRVVRFEDSGQFGTDTGLSGDSSDWLFAAQYKQGRSISITSRSLIDDDLDVNVAETRFDYFTDRVRLGGSYIYRAAAPLADRFDETSELAVDGALQIDPNWRARADWRYEADEGRSTRAGVGVTYQNECVGVDLSLSRRFTSSTTVEPATDITLRVFLSGFGGGDNGQRPPSRCRG
ncbi:MAG: LPS assembly protein LptD [Pseudomonadota bacterium]